MPGNLPEVSPYLILTFLGIIGSIIGVWIWVILRLALSLPVLPPSRPRIVPWGAGSVLAAMVVWYGTTWLVVVAYSMTHPRAMAFARANGGMPPPVDLMTMTALYNAASLVAVPLILMVIARAKSRDFGLEGPGLLRQFVTGIVAYPLLAPLVFGVNVVAISIWKPTRHPLQDAIEQNLSPGLATLMIVAGAILAPMTEELVFRGVLLGWLTRIALRPRGLNDPKLEPTMTNANDPGMDLVLLPEFDTEDQGQRFDDDRNNPYRAPSARYSPVSEGCGPDSPAIDTRGRWPALLTANLIVSIVFAALHGSVWPSPVPIFFLSIGLGFLYQRTGSLVAPIALHMTFNGVSTLVMFLAIGLNPQGAPKVPEPAKAVGVYSQIKKSVILALDVTNRD